MTRWYSLNHTACKRVSEPSTDPGGKDGADAVSVYTVEEEVGVWGVGGSPEAPQPNPKPPPATHTPSAEGREHRGRGGPEVLERQTTRVQSGKASSGGGGRADAASCGGDRGPALRKVLVSGGNPTQRRGRVT